MECTIAIWIWWPSRNLRTALECVSWLASQSQISLNRANCAWMSPIFLWTNQNTQLCLTNHAAEKRERKISAFPSAYVRMWEIVVVARLRKGGGVGGLSAWQFPEVSLGSHWEAKVLSKPIYSLKSGGNKSTLFYSFLGKRMLLNSKCNTLSLPSSFHKKARLKYYYYPSSASKHAHWEWAFLEQQQQRWQFGARFFLSKRGFAEGVTG